MALSTVNTFGYPRSAGVFAVRGFLRFRSYLRDRESIRQQARQCLRRQPWV
ncbi:MAG: hypothetical protein H6981_07325 [Gammaproteobacteria bacterium]|nr:hypothetical protein [Gammaproteobacteria bacterium]